MASDLQELDAKKAEQAQMGQQASELTEKVNALKSGVLAVHMVC